MNDEFKFKFNNSYNNEFLKTIFNLNINIIVTIDN